MPLPDDFKTYVASRRFWTDFLWVTDTERSSTGDPYPLLKDFQLRLSVADGFELLVSLDEFLCCINLDLVVPGKEPQNIAWDDQAHWHPHVLRWEELELICRRIAARDADLPHPGYPLLLLHRFAPICEGDNINHIVAMLETAWRQLDMFSSSEITTFIERIDARDSGFRWCEHAGLGWCIEQPEERSPMALYSLRDAANEEFPFADWRNLIDAAGAGPQLPEQSLSTPSCFPRKQHIVQLTIPHQDVDRPAPVPFARVLNLAVDCFLRDLQWGRSEPSGGTSRPNEDGTLTQIETRSSLQLKGDLNASLDLLRGALWWSKAPASVRLSQGYSASIPFDLNEEVPTVPLILQLGRLVPFRWNSGYRLDPVPWSESIKKRIRESLSQADVVGPDDDGWYDMTMPDDGILAVCAKQLEDDGKCFGISLMVNQLSPDVSAWIYQRMVEDKMMILPAVIAASEEVAQPIDTPWPSVFVVRDVDHLHEILTAGPYVWWKQ